jgi:putative spermidine/putrescine transport system substrate-binding protein
MLAGAATAGVMIGVTPASGASVSHKSVNSSKVPHLDTPGSATSYKALVKAAKKEGKLNAIALPGNWANYGAIMKEFHKKFGIKVNDANPEGSSAQELEAIKDDRGRSNDPDVVDVGNSFALQGQQEKLFAPYKVLTWKHITASQKGKNGDWFADYGGYVAIGCNSKAVMRCPTTFKQMLKKGQGYKIGLNGNPTTAGAAFAAVFAAALSNGGSFNNIRPGIKYFQKLNKEGSFVPVTAGPTTVESGQTNIIIWWDYLQASEINSLKAYSKSWKVVIPKDGIYAAYYDQAINAGAPDPAAARLWEEFLYSAQGQNLWLEGEARPIELNYLVASGKANKKALAKLPAAPKGVTKFPTPAQLNKAAKVVQAEWGSV